MTDLPVAPLPDDVVDRIAKEVAAQVRDHIEQMYPAAAKAVAWKSASRSVQGLVCNTMSSAARAAESGRIDQWLKETARSRIAIAKMHRDNAAAGPLIDAERAKE